MSSSDATDTPREPGPATVKTSCVPLVLSFKLSDNQGSKHVHSHAILSGAGGFSRPCKRNFPLSDRFSVGTVMTRLPTGREFDRWEPRFTDFANAFKHAFLSVRAGTTEHAVGPSQTGFSFADAGAFGSNRSYVWTAEYPGFDQTHYSLCGGGAEALSEILEHLKSACCLRIEKDFRVREGLVATGSLSHYEQDEATVPATGNHSLMFEVSIPSRDDLVDILKQMSSATDQQ